MLPTEFPEKPLIKKIMKEYLNHSEIYFEVVELSANNFIAKPFNNNHINEIQASSYEECVRLMKVDIDELINYCNNKGVILKRSIPDGFEPFAKLLKDFFMNNDLRNSDLVRMKNLVMNQQLKTIFNLISSGSVFDIAYGHNLCVNDDFFSKNDTPEYNLFTCAIKKCKSLRFLDSRNMIRQFKIDDYNFTFEFTNSGRDGFLEVFHFEYCNFIGDNKQGSLEIEKDCFDMYTYKIFNAEDLFFENNSGYCVSRTYYDWAEKFFPIKFSLHSVVNEDDALQWRKRYFFSIFIETLMKKRRDIDWLRSFIQNNNELKQVLNSLVVKFEDVEKFCNKSESKYDKEKIIQILNKDVINDDLISDIKILSDVLSDKKQKEFNKDMILDIEKRCWFLIHSKDHNPLALIVRLNLEDKMTDIEIFNHMFPNEKEYAAIKDKLGFRDASLANVKNKAQKINQQYKKIMKLAEENGLPVPNLKKRK